MLQWALLAASVLATTLLPTAGWAKGKKDLLAYYDHFQKVDNLFDASGVAQLPDGRLLVVQDDWTIPIAFLRREGNRFVAETWAGDSLAGRSGNKIDQVDDLEEVVLARDGFLYVLSSHAKLEGFPSRQSFARFRLNGERMEEAAVVTDLEKALVAAHPALAQAANIQEYDGGLNLEGFTFDPDGKRALLGFRAPLADNKAIVVPLENPTALFSEGAAPQLGEVTLLDLAGEGIRAMAWLPKINGYLITSRTDSRTGKRPFRLWFWSGDTKAKPRAVSIDSLKSLRRPEGIAPVVIDGEERILLVSDEGNRDEGKASRVALIAYERLRIAP